MLNTIIALLTLVYGLSVHAQNITSVNFVQEGEVSKLIIESDKPIVAERFAVPDDKQIILDLKGTQAPAKLLRGIDTSEFSGAVVYVSGYPRPGAKQDLRFAIQLRDNVRSIIESNGNRTTLSIENRFGVFSRSKMEKAEPKGGITANAATKPDVSSEATAAGPNRNLNVPKSTSIEDILDNLVLAGPKKYVGKRISINVKKIKVADLLAMIADTSGFNIIIDDGVDKIPDLTLSLVNVPWDQALDTIMGISKLTASKSSSILMVKTLDQATLEQEARLKAEKLKIGLEPLVTKVFPINYADITSLLPILKDYLTPDRSSLQQDPRTNSLIVKDTLDSIERVKKIIELLDTQTPQVLIEAKIVEANENYSKRIGLSHGLSFGYDPIPASTNLPTSAGPGFSFSSAPSSSSTPFMGFNVTAFKRLANLDFNLELMESEGKGRIITSPKVITQNKKPATITSTEKQNFLLPVVAGSTGATAPTISSVSIDLKLTVTPQVTNEGAINMDVSLSKGSFTTPAGGSTIPGTTQRLLSTNVLVDNGSTVVLGGLYNTNTSESHSGVPFLKDLPLVGWLFRTPYNPSTSRSELLIFLTPRIINAEEAGFSERTSGVL